MKIPEFKQSKRLLGDRDIPCLVAKVRNSKLPGVASRHIAEIGKDPMCEIYLRSKDSKKISPWQKEILKELLEKEGLAAAVSEAMEEYSGSTKWGNKNYAELSAEDRADIQKHGIASHIAISIMVVDEVKKKVILRADTIIDGHLDEHGISIYLSKGRWRFELADYFDRYRSTLVESSQVKEGKTALQELIKGYDFKQQEWERLFPASELEGPPTTDPGLATGRWALDKPETVKLMKKLKMDALEIQQKLGGVMDQTDIAVSITRDSYELFSLTPPFHNFEHIQLIGFQRRGNRVAITTLTKQPLWMRVKNDKGSKSTRQYWSDGKIFVTNIGFVYKPTKQKPVQGELQNL